MTLPQKLDYLQEIARAHTDSPYEAYLVVLLAEHVEEDEMTADFLRWLARSLGR